jgi:hypothetical protein
MKMMFVSVVVSVIVVMELEVQAMCLHAIEVVADVIVVVEVV